MPPTEGVDYMKGSVQPAEYNPNRFYIQIWWQGGLCKLWFDCDSFQPFYSRKRAKKYLSIVQQQIDNGWFNPAHWKPDSPILIKNRAIQWIEDKQGISDKTRQGYKIDIKKYIIPSLGNRDFRKLRAGEIQDLYINLIESKGGDIPYKALSTLKTMLNDLYRREEIMRVPPFPRLSRPSEQRVVNYLTLVQQEAILKKIPERHRPIFEFGMEYGLRTQEVRAIMWDCLPQGRVIIKRAFSENQLRGTKTGDEREMKQTSYTADILSRAKKHTSTTFVFVRGDGKPYTNKNLNEIWHPAEKASGIRIKLQDAMRHSLACQLLDQGVDIYTVSKLLGHKSIRTTMKYLNRRTTPSADQALEGRRGGVVGMVKKREIEKIPNS
jgi:integrase